MDVYFGFFKGKNQNSNYSAVYRLNVENEISIVITAGWNL